MHAHQIGHEPNPTVPEPVQAPDRPGHVRAGPVAGCAQSAAENLLSRLQRVKRTGPGRWIASCPTREDRHPSLAIRELDDGRVLVHDFGGDDVGAIVAAVGLELADLFPHQPGDFKKPVRHPFRASDVLVLMAHEANVAVLVCSDVLRKRQVSEKDFNRLLMAARRLGDAAEVCHAYG